jgi:hypothetical protein
LVLAEKHRGKFVTIPEATSVILNGNGTEAARRKLYQAVYRLKETGRLQGGRGVFMLPAPVVQPKRTEDDDLAVVTPRPAGRLAVRHQLARLAHLRNEFDALFDEVLSDCHKANGSADAVSDGGERPSFPMRCAEPWERDE